MKLLRDYLCESCGTVQERFIDCETVAVDCACGEIAKRVIGMPKVMLDGTDASFPGAYDKWARIREDNARIKSKRSYAE